MSGGGGVIIICIYIKMVMATTGGLEESSFRIKQRPLRRSVNAGMSRAKFSFLIGPNTVLLFFIIYNIHPMKDCYCARLLFDSLFIYSH